ncbi:MAG: ATP-binding protein [Deltaproteobacteria bacterium]|nr:ATP-binding protein [Deltaproteobacteria bacterium]
MLRADDYEKLGSFYLGRVIGADGAPSDAPLLYDAKDLTTHGVCVGMTGSGKTGLCLALLEEAAIDGIPALAIDPKGDLGNLLLTFPQLRAEDFAPWIDPAEAARAGATPADYAKTVADRWRKGLADWGQAPERIGAFRSAADVAIYTPGSTAGRPLRLLRSFDAPPPALASDAEAVRERLQAAVASLLALLGVDADPIQSRESILLQNVVNAAWSKGENLDLASLIRAIQQPPFERVGVFDLESFYPAKERMALAMNLNNLLASPSFGAWLEGEPLDIARLLYTPEGKPRLSVLSIAHLSDGERMFFVTLLLSELIAWMRAQPGTQSLRALLYMDEIFGYFPPTANPPSKQPMLTLLKQARAYGVGVMLATQNPVDLDYKGLANTGTWFLGRLQTERDKLRVLEGLEGASTATGKAFDRGAMERVLAGLGNRKFLMHNVHDDAPTLFESRWALSYLRGPLTREQIRKLTAPSTPAPSAAPGVVTAAPSAPPAPAAEAPAARPTLPTGIEERFAAAPATGTGGALAYEPHLFATASAHYVNAAAKLDTWQSLALSSRLDEASADAPWEALTELPGKPALAAGPAPGASFAPLPALAERPASYARWAKMLESKLFQARPLTIYECRALKATSNPGESLGDFRARLRDKLHESRDLELEKLRQKWAPKLAQLQERLRRAEERAEREKDEYSSKKLETAVSMGASVLGALFGRKLASATNVGRAASVAKSVGRAARQKEDIARAEEGAEAIAAQLKELEAAFNAEVDALRTAGGVEALEISEITVAPRKGDLSVDGVALLWVPRA